MSFENLTGKHLISVIVDKEQNEVIFNVRDSDGNISEHKMFHQKYCNEWVFLEDIIGDIDDLQDATVLMAEVATEGEFLFDMWTFYRIQTNKGHVDFRWHGESTGCYSVEVDFI